MSTGDPNLTKSTQNNSALEITETGEYFHDSYMNIVAETLVKDVLQDVGQSVQNQDQDQEEQFYDVTTGLENCKLDSDDDDKGSESSEPPKDDNLSAGDENPPKSVNDSSLTDDEIEVICRYSSPNVATDFKKELDEMAEIEKQVKPEGSDNACGTENKESSLFPECCTPQKQQFQNGDGSTTCSPMYLRPECCMSPSDMCSPPVSDANYFNHSLMYQQPPPTLPEQMYPPHLLETQILQQQEMAAQTRTCEQLGNSYITYSTGEPQSPMYSNYAPQYPNSPYAPPFNNGQYPMVGLGGTPACNYSGEPSFIYPSIYVSSSGLITVLLRNDTSVEMTIDRTVRIVSHKSKMAVASSSRGNMSILYHPTVKLYQDGSVTNVQINGVKAKMATDDIWFANEIGSFKFDSNLIEPATLTYRDMSKDDSVNLLFSADTYGEKLVPQCLEVASVAEYENLPKGGVQVRINGVKITQSGRGDVVVVTGPKYLKMSPSNGLIRINTQYIEVTVERDSSTRIRRGGHILTATDGRVILSNGRIEAGFDEHGRLKVLSLPGRSPMEVGVRRGRRQPGPPRNRTSAYLLGGAY